MKKLFLAMLLIAVPMAIFAQFKPNAALQNLSQSDFTMVERNNDGSIKSVRYAITDPSIPATANEFLNETLKKREADDFVLDRSDDTDYGMHFERYQQYYQGVKVDDGHYNFRFKDGRMKVARGHYVDVIGINPVPSITENDAITFYANYFGIAISDTIESCVNLVIKEIPIADKKESVVALTYKVFLLTSKIEGSYIGYVDAHTGKLLFKEDAVYSATGQFYTYYNRNPNDAPKSGTTYLSNNIYVLRDTTCGNGILTYNNDYPQALFSDNDNIWNRNEMGVNNIALDVHWTMGKIWNTMVTLFHYNSYDGNGGQVYSTIENTNSAECIYSSNNVRFFFGNASNSIMGPHASVDIIGHEYGHAISIKTTKIGQNGAISEGLADIWGIIFEEHITPNASRWKFGEQIMLNGNSCMRNFQNPDDVTALTQIASTYGYGLYNSSDPHIAGGILPYWFYLLVNGGSGINGYNNSFQLIPIGFDLAETLFTRTALNTAYLEGCTTFQEVGLAFLDVAYDMNNAFLIEQVQNALYAVGLYTEPLHIYLQSYNTGSATYYVKGNSNCSVNWSFTKTSGSTPSLVPNSNNYSCTLYSSSPFSGFLYATINCGGCTATYSKYISFAGSPSSVGDDVMQVIPVNGTHYRISVGGECENGTIKVYDASSLKVQLTENRLNEDYVLDTSSWKRGLYVVEVTIGNKTYTKKITVK